MIRFSKNKKFISRMGYFFFIPNNYFWRPRYNPPKFVPMMMILQTKGFMCFDKQKLDGGQFIFSELTKRAPWSMVFVYIHGSIVPHIYLLIHQSYLYICE